MATRKERERKKEKASERTDDVEIKKGGENEREREKTSERETLVWCHKSIRCISG